MRKYPYWIVRTEGLRREAEQYGRQRGIPKSFLRRVSGFRKTFESTFTDEASAKEEARRQHHWGKEVEVFVVNDYNSPRQRVRWGY